MEQHTLTWNDIADVAESFCHWSGDAGGRELEWFHEAWRHIKEAGLANYCTELQRCQVSIRFLALCCIYADFCHLVMPDVTCEPFFGGALDSLGIETFQLAMLLDTNDREEFAHVKDEPSFLDEVLPVLTDYEREAIFRVLSKGFDKVGQGATDLFISMWRVGAQEEDERSDEDILEYVVDYRNDAFLFVVADAFICERWY